MADKIPVGHRFQKGQSGNPGGRHKDLDRIRELARAHGPDAIKALAEALHDKNVRCRIVAAEALLDRGFGRPTQTVEATINVLDRLTIDDKRALLEIIDADTDGEGDAAGDPGTRH